MILPAYLRAASARVAALALGGLFVALVPALIAPEDFGRYSLALSAAQIASAALLSWPNMPFVAEARRQWHRGAGFGSALGARLVLFAVTLPLAAAVLVAVLATAQHVEGTALAGTVLLMMAMAASELATAVGLVAARFAGIGLGTLLVRVGQFGGLGMAGVAALPAWSVLLAGAVLGYLAAALVSLYQVPRDRWWPLAVRRETVVLLVRHGWPLVFASLAATLSNWLGVWVIGWRLGLEPAGQFAWAFGLTALATALFAPLAATLLPHRLDAESAGRPWPALRLALAATAALTALAALLLPPVLWGVKAIGLGAYAPALPALTALAAATPLQLAIAILEPGAMGAAHRVRRAALAMMAMAAVNFAATLLLLPVLGIAGAAVGTGAGLVVCVYGLARAQPEPMTHGTVVWLLPALLPLPWLAALAVDASPASVIVVCLLLVCLFGWFAARIGAADFLRLLRTSN